MMKEETARGLCFTVTTFLAVAAGLVFDSRVIAVVTAFVVLLVGLALSERVFRWLVRK